MGKSTEVIAMIEQMATSLQETEDSLVDQRGPVIDAMKVVIPMQRDQLAILRAIAIRLD